MDAKSFLFVRENCSSLSSSMDMGPARMSREALSAFLQIIRMVLMPGATPSQPSGMPLTASNSFSSASAGRLPYLSGNLFVMIWSALVRTATSFSLALRYTLAAKTSCSPISFHSTKELPIRYVIPLSVKPMISFSLSLFSFWSLASLSAMACASLCSFFSFPASDVILSL